MSIFAVPVVRIKGFGKVPGADTLSVTDVEGSPVVFKTGSLQVNDLAVYVPVDAVVSIDHPLFSFLAKTPEDLGKGKLHRIKARKFCKTTFSRGMLIPLSEVVACIGQEEGRPIVEGDDLVGPLAIVKYEEPLETLLQTESRSDPSLLFSYDVEPWRKNKGEFVEGEAVVIHEKLHGQNGRCGFTPEGEFCVGSHNCWKKPNEQNLHWMAVKNSGLQEKLAKANDSLHMSLGAYFEVVGPDAQKEATSKMWYGCKPGNPTAYVFDLVDLKSHRFLGEDEMKGICTAFDIATVPLLYRGPYNAEAVLELAEGQSTLGKHIREGWVMKPVLERRSHAGRCIYKLKGQAYELRQGGSEKH